MQEYVVGFMYNEAGVVLIRKNRPQWQAGLHNGVGGHVEDYDESLHDAMVREFEEETGVRIGPWMHFLTLEGVKAKVHCFAMEDVYTQWIPKVDTLTDEQVSFYYFQDLSDGLVKVVPNLKWIIPLMRQHNKYEPITVRFYGDA